MCTSLWSVRFEMFHGTDPDNFEIGNDSRSYTFSKILQSVYGIVSLLD